MIKQLNLYRLILKKLCENHKHQPNITPLNIDNPSLHSEKNIYTVNV